MHSQPLSRANDQTLAALSAAMAMVRCERIVSSVDKYRPDLTDGSEKQGFLRKQNHCQYSTCHIYIRQSIFAGGDDNSSLGKTPANTCILPHAESASCRAKQNSFARCRSPRSRCQVNRLTRRTVGAGPASGGWIPSFLLPAPSAIAAAGFDLPPTVWLGHIWATLRIALTSYALAIEISIPLAVALTNSRLLSRTLYPILIIIQSTPIIAIAPIIVVTLGASDMPRVVITFLITFFPIVVTTSTGLLAAPRDRWD
jgi:hypothetical protein